MAATQDLEAMMVNPDPYVHPFDCVCDECVMDEEDEYRWPWIYPEMDGIDDDSY